MIEGFNPRARVGRDDPSPANRPRPGCFNPRARVGRDIIFRGRTLGKATFQSTRPRGARLEVAREDLVI